MHSPVPVLPESLLGREKPTSLRGLAVDEALHILAADETLQRGGVNLISLEPIAERLGERWDRKREDVWIHVETFLRRQFRPEDLIVRLDDVNVLIAQPGKETLSAQSLCVRAAAELMKFFVGETCVSSVRVKVVDAIEQEKVTATLLPPERIETMLLAHSPDVGRPARVMSTPVLSRLGRQVSLALSLEPLWSLQPAPRLIGHHVKVGLSDGVTGAALTNEERSHLQPGELADIDVAVMNSAIAMRAASPKLVGGLIIPVSYLTLANSSTRYQMLQDMQRLDPADRKSFGWEIVDLEDGVPVGRLSELVGIARRHCRGVICRLGLSVSNAEKVTAAGATLSIHKPDEPFTELALFRLQAITALALKSVRALMLQDIPAELLPIVSFIGVTHCTASRSGQ